MQDKPSVRAHGDHTNDSERYGRSGEASGVHCNGDTGWLGRRLDKHRPGNVPCDLKREWIAHGAQVSRANHLPARVLIRESLSHVKPHDAYQ